MDVKGEIKKVLGVISKIIKSKIILITILIVILLGGCLLILDEIVVSAASEGIQSSLSQNTTIENNQIVIQDTVYDDILNKLKEQGLDPYSLYLDPSQGYIQKYVQAEAVTSYPKMGTEGMQGIINFIRRDADATEGDAGTLMTYMPYEEFNNIVSQQTESAFQQIKNCFSLDMTTMEALVATYTSISGTENSYNIAVQRIAYKNQVAKYTMPFEFLISLLQVSRNPEFVVSLADMVINNSKINYTIQDCVSNIKTTEIYTYDEVTYEPEYEGNTLVAVNTTTTSKTETNKDVTTVVNSILPYISQVDTWIVNVDQYYDKSVTDVNNSQVQELEDEQVSTTVQRKNRKITTTETGKTIKYISSVSVSGETPEVVQSSEANFNTNVDAVGKVAKMMNWAEGQVGKTQYTGMGGIAIANCQCARFVSNCYWAAGFKYLGGNANAMTNLGTHYSINRKADGTIDYSDIPLGACLVSLKGTYGHVAIYVGDGYIIEAGVSPIRKIQIDKAWKADSYAYWALRKRVRRIYGIR